MRALVMTGLVAALALASGCNATKRELVVFFGPSATSAQHDGALKSCTGVAPHTSPEPRFAGKQLAGRSSDVRFRIDSANDHDIALLENCLQRQPGVIGVQDTSDQN